MTTSVTFLTKKGTNAPPWQWWEEPHLKNSWTRIHTHCAHWKNRVSKAFVFEFCIWCWKAGHFGLPGKSIIRFSFLNLRYVWRESVLGYLPNRVGPSLYKLLHTQLCHGDVRWRFHAKCENKYALILQKLSAADAPWWSYVWKGLTQGRKLILIKEKQAAPLIRKSKLVFFRVFFWFCMLCTGGKLQEDPRAKRGIGQDWNK